MRQEGVNYDSAEKKYNHSHQWRQLALLRKGVPRAVVVGLDERVAAVAVDVFDLEWRRGCAGAVGGCAGAVGGAGLGGSGGGRGFSFNL